MSDRKLRKELRRCSGGRLCDAVKRIGRERLSELVGRNLEWLSYDDVERVVDEHITTYFNEEEPIMKIKT